MAFKAIAACAWVLGHCAKSAEGALADADLMTFVSNPTIRPPFINVTRYDTSQITPGYWFVAPYADLSQRDPGKLAVPAQVGPHIYKDDGTLVWSGAELFSTRSICDFRQVIYNGTLALSFIVTGRASSTIYPQGAALILDETYSIVEEILSPLPRTAMNMHEFKVEDNGLTALLLYDTPVQWPDFHDSYHEWGFVDSGFAAIDVRTKLPSFMWNASDHISLTSSTKPSPGPGDRSVWDWIHLNSVDRDPDGDFLITGRHTDAIYKISKSMGKIVWQLGGIDSSFELVGFNFSRQHDARFIQTNQSATILSILNNASDGIDMTANCSSVQIIKLDHETMMASVIQQWNRPDGELSHLRGNVQILPDTNVFVGWSGNDGYMTEHSSNGNVLMEARFLSDRLSTYRAYKFFNFRGKPLNPPSLQAHVFQITPSKLFTIIYVSWNGATDVACWKFYGSPNTDTENFTFLGRKDKTGFETIYTHIGFFRYIVAEAVAADGTPLRNSTARTPEVQDDACLMGTESNMKCLFELEEHMHSNRGAETSVTADGLRCCSELNLFAQFSKLARLDSIAFVTLGICLSYILNPLQHRRQTTSSCGKE